MKQSQLRRLIQEQVKAIMNEQSNPELDKLVSKFVQSLATKYQYGEHDALYAIFDSLKRQQMLSKDVDFRPY